LLFEAVDPAQKSQRRDCSMIPLPSDFSLAGPPQVLRYIQGHAQEVNDSRFPMGRGQGRAKSNQLVSRCAFVFKRRYFGFRGSTTLKSLASSGAKVESASLGFSTALIKSFRRVEPSAN